MLRTLPSTLPSFDELRALAEHQPEMLEMLRRELTDAVIARASPRHRRRLRGLQFQIETRCRLAGSPLAACIWISGQMHDKLETLRQAFDQPQPPLSRSPCRIMKFPPSGSTCTTGRPPS